MPQLHFYPGQAVASEVDFDKPGKQSGFLRVSHSVHRSAYGWLPVPVAVIANGEGPTVLVMAGNHGDEFEGQIVVSRLMREIELESVCGRIILLPMANFPAAQAGLRTSPLDDGNLNRLFPGDPKGSITQVLASYIENVLIQRSTLVIDLHSGGSSLMYHGGVVFAAAPRDEDEQSKLTAMLQAFGMQFSCFRKTVNPSTTIGAARRHGATTLTAEFGGGGLVDENVLRSAWQGVCSLLANVGVIKGELVPSGPPSQTRLLSVDFNSDLHHVYARIRGVFEPVAKLGDRVQPGQIAALLHEPSNPMNEPVKVFFEGSGVVICKRVPALVEPGDCLFQLGEIHAS